MNIEPVSLPDIPAGPHNLAAVRALSTDQLKAMWGDRTDRFEHLWEEIHKVMNERGEGEYVAV